MLVDRSFSDLNTHTFKSLEKEVSISKLNK